MSLCRELILGAFWLAYTGFFLLIGAHFSELIILEILFNVLPILFRLIAIGVDRKYIPNRD